MDELDIGVCVHVLVLAIAWLGATWVDCQVGTSADLSERPARRAPAPPRRSPT